MGDTTTVVALTAAKPSPYQATSYPATTFSATPASTSTPPKSPPIANFPLPQELRDMIHGFLLDAEQVVALPYRDISAARAAATGQSIADHPRDASMAHTYEFHTSILAVNKEISDEATKIFCKNAFVIVTASWSGLTSALLRLDVPIICLGVEKSRKATAYAALAMFPRHPEDQLDEITDGLIVAGRDLPLLRKAMCWTFMQLSTTFDLTITNDDDTEKSYTIEIGDSGPDVVKMSLLFLDPNVVLKCFQTYMPYVKAMSFPRQEVKVYFGSFDYYDEDISKGMEDSMNSKTLSASEFICEFLQTILVLKSNADKVAQKGSWGQKLAISRYTDIIHTWRSCDLVRSYLRAPQLMEEAKFPLSTMLQVIIDAASTSAEIQMRLHGLDGSRFLHESLLSCNEDAQSLVKCPYGPEIDEVVNPSSHLLLVWPLLEDADDTTIRTAKTVLSAFLLASPDEEADSRQRMTHDIAELDRILNDPDLLEKCCLGDPEGWQGLSCHQFPPRVINTGVLEIFAEHLLGWN